MGLPLKDIVNVQLGVSSGGPGISEDIPVRGIGLSKYFWEMRVTERDTLYPVFNPTNSNDRKVYWSEDSGSTVVTVDDKGQVTGVGVGQAYVTCITEDGSYRARCLYNILRALIPVTSITLDKSSATIEEGQSVQLTPTVLPENADDKSVGWLSSDTKVATVTETGLVIAVKAGKCNITAINNSVTSNPCAITVTPPVVHVTGVRLNETSLQLLIGDTEQLEATVVPTNATDQSVTWKSSNTSVATVDADGLVTCIKDGSTTITVTTNDGGYGATCSVKVLVPIVHVTGVTIDNGDTAEMENGDTLQLTVTVKPDDATNKNVVFDTTDPNVLTVSATGLVTAVGNGSAAITATTEDGGYTDSISISVAVPHVAVTGVTIDEGETGQVVKGETTQLHATVAPEDASVKDVTWESSDTTIATVDSTGLVKGIEFGNATISVKTVEGEFTDSIAMTVPSPASLRTDSFGNALAGNTTKVGYTTDPPNSPLTDIAYSSSDESIATVDADGTVHFIAEGSCSISMSAKSYGEPVSDSSSLYVSELSVATDSLPALTVGATQQLVVTIKPDWVPTERDYVIEYTTTDAGVATVSNTGLITGVADGGCRIGATVTVGNATASDSSYQTVNAA